MKKILITLLVSSGLLSAMDTKAQDFVKGNPGMYPEFIDFKNAPAAFNKGSVILADDKGSFTSSSGALLAHSEKDNLSMEHFRYQQSYLGIPVENAIYVMHVKGNTVLSQNGKWVKDFPAGLKNAAAINFSAALQKAMAAVGAQSYKWQIPAEEAFIKREQNDFKATFYPKSELVWYSGENEVIPASLRLAYKLDIYAQYPMSRQIVFVDAVNGSILGTRELIHTTNATGTAVTAYTGTQTITTDFTGTTYRLRETGRGNGINTYDMRLAGTNYGAAVDFTDADNNWNNVNANKDQYATDGHWGTEKTYDFYLSKFNRNSVDNAGFALNSYVHTNLVAFGYGNNINAFWDGTRMTYGDGGTSGSTTYTPLTALDVCGHEITHGVTERTSNLVYSKESGAMNEGFSDIFGTAIEFYAKGTGGNWLIGENIGAAFRNMANPNQFSQPDTYGGTYWVNTTSCTPSNNNDQCGVHTNSGVLNFWFYLLSQGGSGTNDIGSAYTVTGIGIDKAAAIAYRTNTTYLISTSTYANARTYAIQSAIDLYGAGSAEVIATTNAWYAVGIGAAYSSACGTPTALTASAITSSGATLGWTAGSNAVSYLVEYKLSSASTWTTLAAATTATSVAVTGLTASTAYDWRVTTNCSASTSTAATASFTTTAVASGCAAAFEPNETLATAASITSGVTNSAAISSTTDIDYFKIVTTATSSNVFNLVGPGGVDYDLYIYNSAGTQIGSGTGSTATETVSLTSQAAGTYYIKVIGYNGANSATCYTIKATATVATSCQSALDVSTNGTISGAAVIPFNTNVTGLISPSGDNDYYKFVITNGGTATITLTTLPADYDLTVVNSAGTQLAISQNGGTTSETISRTYTAGTYYARVFGYNNANNASTCYTLKVQLGTASITGNGTEITGNGLLKVYPSPATNVLNVSVLGEIAPKATLKVVNISGAVVMEEKISSNIQQVNISTLPKGVYLLKINNGETVLSSKFVKQ
ncbi:M4 family metallopeptidase [Ferruginibacter profundus]